MEKFAAFARIAEIEFADVVLSTQDLGHKLRIYLIDKSFIDLSYTTELEIQRFTIHWERTHIDKSIYRLDNAPDRSWRKVETFPLHFHDKKYDKVGIPPFSVDENLLLKNIFRRFLRFARLQATA